MTSGLTRTQ